MAISAPSALAQMVEQYINNQSPTLKIQLKNSAGTKKGTLTTLASVSASESANIVTINFTDVTFTSDGSYGTIDRVVFEVDATGDEDDLYFAGAATFDMSESGSELDVQSIDISFA